MSQKNNDDHIFEIPSKLKCYDVIEKIGEGGYSVVFKVQQTISKKYFAAKIMSKKEIVNRKKEYIISNEINILRSIKHPNIIRLFDVFEVKNQNQEDLIIMIEELCSNGSLLDYVNNKGFKNNTEKKRMMKNIIEVIAYLHGKNIAHCDIKVDNILLDENFNIKLGDFGFSKNFNKNANNRINGTLTYAAPELFTQKNIDFFKSDIWALGVTLYALEESHLPYEDFHCILKPDFIPIMRNRQFMNIIQNCFKFIPRQRPNINDLLNNEYFSIIENDNMNKNKVENVSTIINKNNIETDSQDAIS